MSTRHKTRCLSCGRIHKDSHEKRVGTTKRYSERCYVFRDSIYDKMGSLYWDASSETVIKIFNKMGKAADKVTKAIQDFSKA